MVAYCRIQREHLLRRQQGVAYRRRYNNEIRAATATTATTKGIGKNQKIAKTYRTISVQIGPGVIPVIALTCPKHACKDQEICKTNHPIAVEIRICRLRNSSRSIIGIGYSRGLPHA